MASASQYVLNFLTMVVLARLLSPAEFGVASLAVAFLAFARLFSEIAMAPALIRRESIDDVHVDVAFISVITLALIAGAATVLAAPLIADFFSAPDLRAMCTAIAVLLPVHGAISIWNALLSRKADFRFMAVSTFPGLLFGYAGVTIFLAWRGFGAWAIIFGTIAQQVLTVIIIAVRAGYLPRLRWKRSTFEELLSFSLGQSVAQMVNQCALSGDNFVVGRALGMESLGLYGRAYKLMELPVNIISTTSCRVAFPLMSSIQAHKDRLSEAFLASLSALLTLLIPLSIFLIFAARPVVLLVMGPNWEGVVAPFQILCASLTFRAAYRHVNLPTMVVGKSFTIAILSALYAAWVILGAVLAVTVFGGIVAVAIAVSIAIFVHYLTSAWSANRLLRFGWVEFFKLHLPGLSIGAVMTVALWLVHESPWFGGHLVLDLLSDMLAASLAMILCVLFRPRMFLGERVLSTLRKITHLIPVGRERIDAWIANALRTPSHSAK